MSMQFLTTMTEQEFKELLKDAMKEVLREERSTSKELPEILDVQQAAQFLKLKITTLYEKTCHKLIPHFKKGNKLYFNFSELQKWVSAGKVKTNEEIACEAITFSLKKRT